MRTPQGGLFALGTASHAYLEFDDLDGRKGSDLVAAISSLREPRTTMGGVNLVAGFRPELWRKAVPDDAPAQMQGFDRDVVGIDGFRMPATQHDAVLWISGMAYDVVFDVSRAAVAALAGVASLADETSSWPYQKDRDLTGFIDGSENPDLIDAPEFAVIAEGNPGAGGSILLLQKWVHDTAAWEGLSVEQQEKVIGRMKRDSVEIENKAPDSHVASTDQDRFGKIFRRNMPYGTVTQPRHHVRRLQRRPAAPLSDAGEHGRSRRRRTRRAHAVHPAPHRRVLLRSLDGAAASAGGGAVVSARA